MTDDDWMIQLYDDGDSERPNQGAVDRAFAVVVVTMLKLDTREGVAGILEGMADHIRAGFSRRPQAACSTRLTRREGMLCRRCSPQRSLIR